MTSLDSVDALVDDDVKLSAEQILSACIEADYQTAMVVGLDKDGKVCVHSTDGLAETVLLMERGKLSILD